MRCKYCGAVFHGEDLKYCPYCENDIEEKNAQPVQQIVYVKSEELSDYEIERRSRVAPEVPEDAKWGELHFKLLKGENWFSPADGCHYFIVVDEYYETEIISTDQDEEAVIKLPYGEHVLKVRMFAYDDDKFENESTYARHDNIRFTVGDKTPRMELYQGTLIKSAKIKIIDD